MATLKTNPTFKYEQGIFGDENWEPQIEINYYGYDLIGLEQEGVEINIRFEHVMKLAKEIVKHKAEADKKLR